MQNGTSFLGISSCFPNTTVFTTSDSRDKESDRPSYLEISTVDAVLCLTDVLPSSLQAATIAHVLTKTVAHVATFIVFIQYAMAPGHASAWKLPTLFIVPPTEVAFIAMHCYLLMSLHGLARRGGRAGRDVMAPAGGDVSNGDVSKGVVEPDSTVESVPARPLQKLKRWVTMSADWKMTEAFARKSDGFAEEL